MNDDDYTSYYTDQYYGQYQPHPEITPDPATDSGRAAQISDDLKPWISDITKVLEVGCGPGRNLVALKKRGLNDITGLEPSLECCEIVQDNGVRCINGTLADSDELLTELGSFDLLILSHMVEHFVEPDAALQIIRKLLADDGLLYILVPNVYDGDYRQQFTIPHTFYFSPNTLELLLRNNGFEIQHIFADRSPEIALVASKMQRSRNEPLPVDQTEYLKAISFLKVNGVKDTMAFVRDTIELSISKSVKFLAPDSVHRFIRDHYRSGASS